MRWTLATGAMLLAAPLCAQDAAIESAVYLEHADEDGSASIHRVGPAARLASGDRVITIMRWESAGQGQRTAVSAVPGRLRIESASRHDLDVSTDGGATWYALGDPESLPAGITHLRWRLGTGAGQLSYRAVVR
jgi:hypothetical protein